MMMEAYKLEYDDRMLDDIPASNLNKIIIEGRKSIKPPPDILPSEWADKNRILPETSAGHGRWKTSNAPHAKAIMDAIVNPEVRKITIMKSSQVGGTEIINNIIGYLIDIDPCSIMIMQPTDADCRSYSLQKLEPMLQDTKCLRDKVAKKKSRDSDNSILRKKFIGGYLSIVSGQTTSSTRQRTARVTIGDDIDGIEIGHTKEGDPVSRLIKRSTTFKKTFLNINVSTPTVEGQSRIYNLYQESNMQKYYVRCPYCGHLQVLNWENLEWKKDYDMFKKVVAHYPETVKYRCDNEECGHLLTEAERLEMLKNGDWIAEKPQIKDHLGFWINEVSSTLSCLENVARSIVAAGDDPDKLEPFYNTVLGLPYRKVQGIDTDPLELIDFVDDFIDKNDPKLPNDILLLTAAADIQAGSGEKPARIEVLVMGWGLGKERWVCFKYIIPGTIKDKAVRDKLDEFWERKWYRKDGYELKIRRKFIDSGYDSLSVYEYTRGRQGEGIYAIKGANKYGAPLIPRKARVIDKKGTLLISIGTQAAKAEIYGCLKKFKQPGPKYTHFAKAFCDSEFFKQLTSEHAVRKTTGMVDYYMYEKKDRRDPNEDLDLMVYNLAAFEHIPINLEGLKKKIDREVAERKEKEGMPAVKEEKEEVKVQKPKAPRVRMPRTNFANSWR